MKMDVEWNHLIRELSHKAVRAAERTSRSSKQISKFSMDGFIEGWINSILKKKLLSNWYNLLEFLWQAEFSPQTWCSSIVLTAFLVKMNVSIDWVLNANLSRVPFELKSTEMILYHTRNAFIERGHSLVIEILIDRSCNHQRLVILVQTTKSIHS